MTLIVFVWCAVVMWELERWGRKMRVGIERIATTLEDLQQTQDAMRRTQEAEAREAHLRAIEREYA